MAKCPVGTSAACVTKAAKLAGAVRAVDTFEVNQMSETFVVLFAHKESALNMTGIRIKLGTRFMMFGSGDWTEDMSTRKVRCQLLHCSCSNLQECLEKRETVSVIVSAEISTVNLELYAETMKKAAVSANMKRLQDFVTEQAGIGPREEDKKVGTEVPSLSLPKATGYDRAKAQKEMHRAREEQDELEQGESPRSKQKLNQPDARSDESEH